MTSYSTDKGVTWSTPQVMGNGSIDLSGNMDDSCSMAADFNGNVFLVYSGAPPFHLLLSSDVNSINGR